MSDDDLDTTIWQKVRGRVPNDQRRPPPTDYVKLLAPYIVGAAVIYAQFQVMSEKVERLEEGTKVQWQKLSHHLENHE
jgi:hypothetical protein